MRLLFGMSMGCWIIGAAWGIGRSEGDVTDSMDLAVVRAVERARVEVIARLSPAVTCLFEKGEHMGGGSGVIISKEGYGLTNYHVVASMLESRVGEAGLSDHRLYDFDVLGIDPTGDVAMILLKYRGASPFVPMGDSDELRVGDWSLAMGNPFLLAEDFTPTVTMGIISGLRRYQWGEGRALRYTECIQVDTSINPGNSGGPLFNLAGELVGINGRVSIEERGRVNVGVGYAISINQIKRFIPALRAGLATTHGTAGFTVADRTDRVVVNQLQEESGAYLIGLRPGDEIVEFGGRTIGNANQFVSVLGTFPGGWPVAITYRHDGQLRRDTIRLEHLPLPQDPRGGMPDASAAPPFEKHPVARSGNRRAARRVLKLLEQSVGGVELLSNMAEARFSGSRADAMRPGDAPRAFSFSEQNSEASSGPGVPTHEGIEREIRWRLWSADRAELAKSYRVVGGDEIGGRIATKLEGESLGGTRHEICLDDANGELLEIQFREPVGGRAVRYVYEDARRTDYLKWPHRRRLYLDDVLVWEEIHTRISASARSP